MGNDFLQSLGSGVGGALGGGIGALGANLLGGLLGGGGSSGGKLHQREKEQLDLQNQMLQAQLGYYQPLLQQQLPAAQYQLALQTGVGLLPGSTYGGEGAPPWQTAGGLLPQPAQPSPGGGGGQVPAPVAPSSTGTIGPTGGFDPGVIPSPSIPGLVEDTRQLPSLPASRISNIINPAYVGQPQQGFDPYATGSFTVQDLYDKVNRYLKGDKQGSLGPGAIAKIIGGKTFEGSLADFIEKAKGTKYGKTLKTLTLPEKMAKGGTLDPTRVALVGEEGPELIVPRGRGVMQVVPMRKGGMIATEQDVRNQFGPQANRVGQMPGQTMVGGTPVQGSRAATNYNIMSRMGLPTAPPPGMGTTLGMTSPTQLQRPMRPMKPMQQQAPPAGMGTTLTGLPGLPAPSPTGYSRTTPQVQSSQATPMPMIQGQQAPPPGMGGMMGMQAPEAMPQYQNQQIGQGLLGGMGYDAMAQLNTEQGGLMGLDAQNQMAQLLAQIGLTPIQAGYEAERVSREQQLLPWQQQLQQTQMGTETGLTPLRGQLEAGQIGSQMGLMPARTDLARNLLTGAGGPGMYGSLGTGYGQSGAVSDALNQAAQFMQNRGLLQSGATTGVLSDTAARIGAENEQKARAEQAMLMQMGLGAQGY